MDTAFEKPVELRGTVSGLNKVPPSGDKAEAGQRHLLLLLAGGRVCQQHVKWGIHELCPCSARWLSSQT